MPSSDDPDSIDLGGITIGPQLPGESGLARRARFHQSWYRARVLKLPGWGRTSSPLARPLGSILTPDHAASGHNFIDATAAEAYRTRRAQGWGVDPVRCTSYMTSSQALTINIFGPLSKNEEWMLRVFGRLLNRSDLLSVEAALLEFAPPKRADYLGDMTRLDLFVQFSTSVGVASVVVETKYVDRFNSRIVEIDRPRYRALAATTGLWAEPSRALAQRNLNQLVRCHALAASVAMRREGELPCLVVVHRADDAGASQLVGEYSSTMSNSDHLRAVTLEDVVRTMLSEARSREQRRISNDLLLRYCLEDESKESWLEYLPSR